MKTHQELVEEMLQDPVVKAEYDALEEEFALFREMLEARKAAGLSQEEVAKRMGTKPSAVTRLESLGNAAKYSPSLSMLRRYADALGCQLDIRLRPKHS